ncbi:MAG: hypothetical protein OXP71_13740 [Candidatus Poribacteria bacterium]|nr:hypothetical protein [Candidatus Poribacteria bacterium]
MNAQRAANDIIDFIRQHILRHATKPAERQTTENIWALRSHLHALHHYFMRSSLPTDLPAHVEAMLATSSGFWKLLSDNEVTLMNLKDYSNVRTLSAEAEGLVNLEELISGEDTLRDVIINGIAFMLNWKSNTLWIDSAKRARRAMTQNYMLEIQDRIWQFVKEGADSTGEIDLARANQIRQRAEDFSRMIQESTLTVEVQVVLLMQIYSLLIRLQLGKLIVRLEEISENH